MSKEGKGKVFFHPEAQMKLKKKHPGDIAKSVKISVDKRG